MDTERKNEIDSLTIIVDNEMTNNKEKVYGLFADMKAPFDKLKTEKLWMTLEELAAE